MFAGSWKIGRPSVLVPTWILKPRRGPITATAAPRLLVYALTPIAFRIVPVGHFGALTPSALAALRLALFIAPSRDLANLLMMLADLRVAERRMRLRTPALRESMTLLVSCAPMTRLIAKLTASPHTTSVASSTQSLSWRSRYGTSPCRKIDRPPGKSRRHWLTGNSPAPPSSWRQA